jgi:hypothetical protein
MLDYELRLLKMNCVMNECRRSNITLISYNLYVVRDIVSIDVDVVLCIICPFRINTISIMYYMSLYLVVASFFIEQIKWLHFV